MAAPARCERGYLAFVWGAPDRPKGTIDAPIDRHPHAAATRWRCAPSGREAITHWQVLERFPGTDGKPVASLVDCRLETGRTHQIRVHLAHAGHPLLGDATYGTGFKTKAARLPAGGAGRRWRALEDRPCMPICWPSNIPTSGQKLEFRSELPADLARLRPCTRVTRLICRGRENPRSITRA